MNPDFKQNLICTVSVFLKKRNSVYKINTWKVDYEVDCSLKVNRLARGVTHSSFKMIVSKTC